MCIDFGTLWAKHAKHHLNHPYHCLGLALTRLAISKGSHRQCGFMLFQARKSSVLTLLYIAIGIALFPLAIYSMSLGFGECEWQPPRSAHYAIRSYADKEAEIKAPHADRAREKEEAVYRVQRAEIQRGAGRVKARKDMVVKHKLHLCILDTLIDLSLVL
ncbi:hypothetical protein K437DRAFT_254212 [Tilletiaria anomala UBC 951]|uniref:Uncharacterized protein n=1 Tax=Tilletiaria anomala (strain ATCC 24038 / CBS 436.72 / UBC 951) TaxID=1037660 RepID=A0A066WIS0_TILAU|nr:uncharacterized protein K437DRAFT_254212 [Tilletiaria anomala UBC 951]KDN52438.1 hypothetical protein K437DRAFT_254212 [Tilletiaria anomala UBC 951]